MNYLPWIIAIILLFTVTVLIGGLVYQKAYSCKNRRQYWDEDYLRSRFEEDKYNDVIQWYQNQTIEELSIQSFDGLKLYGRRIGYETSQQSVILIHGYRSNSNRLLEFARYYHEKLHFNVLLVDLRGHGKSEGDYVGMGFLDSLDVRVWITQECKRIPDGSLILHGISMGAATVLNLSNQRLPIQVKLIVSDSAFTAAKKELLHKLHQLFHVPSIPIYQIAAMIYHIKSHYALRMSCPIKRVRHSLYPILFIHGDIDDYVPVEMAYQLYEACTGFKELYIVPGAGHTFAYRINPQLYFKKIMETFEKYGKTRSNS